MSAIAFASALLDRGIELILRNNGRLHVWPARAYKYLSDAERDFIRVHRAELKALAAAKALPETTVVWQPPTEAPDPAPTPELCQYCHQPIERCAAIKATRPDAWCALHHNDPAEVERRRERADREMYESFRRARRGVR